MRNLILALLTAFLLVGCTKRIYVPVESKITVKETVRDTVIDVRLEREYVKQIVPDTTSTVETKYARATAVWHGDSATLEHSIENKAGIIPTRIQYVEREVEVEKPAPYPVEVKVPVEKPVRMPLRWYERILQYLGIAALGSGAIWIISRIRK